MKTIQDTEKPAADELPQELEAGGRWDDMGCYFTVESPTPKQLTNTEN